MTSDDLGGHFGRDKTRNKVCSRYYWMKMVEDIDNFTAGFANFGHNCENKSSLSRKSSKMGWHKDNTRLANTLRVSKSTPRSYPLFADIIRE